MVVDCTVLGAGDMGLGNGTGLRVAVLSLVVGPLFTGRKFVGAGAPTVSGEDLL